MMLYKLLGALQKKVQVASISTVKSRGHRWINRKRCSPVQEPQAVQMTIHSGWIEDQTTKEFANTSLSAKKIRLLSVQLRQDCGMAPSCRAFRKHHQRRYPFTVILQHSLAQMHWWQGFAQHVLVQGSKDG